MFPFLLHSSVAYLYCCYQKEIYDVLAKQQLKSPIQKSFIILVTNRNTLEFNKFKDTYPTGLNSYLSSHPSKKTSSLPSPKKF